jgi:predicted dehydrogenase
MVKDKVGVGFIGTGFARRVQIPAFLECENAKVVSVASANFANAAATAAEFDIPHWTDNWRETVENKEVDLVCITTPPALHFEQTLYAIAKNKHILCEKPMAMSFDQAREMTEKAREKRILALIDHELRFQEGRQRAFAMLRDGTIGKIRHVKASFRAPHRGDPNLPWNWWSDKIAGGGTLGAIGSHVIDSFSWLLGTEISQVFCQLQTHIKERKDSTDKLRKVSSDDEANLFVRFADSDLTEDATGNISMSMTEYPKYLNRTELFGTKGTIRIEHRGEVFLGLAGENDWTQIEVDLGNNIKGVPDTGFARAFLSFAQKIIETLSKGETKIRHAATFEDGMNVQKVLDAAYKSNETGCIVSLK